MIAKLFGRVAVFLLFVGLVGCSDDTATTQAIPSPLGVGPYAVGVTRIELFDAAQGRTQLTEIWYPAAESARGLPADPAENYLPDGLESLAENATIPLVAVRDVPISGDAPFPLIGFSHGSGGVRYQNTFQCEHLASHGYIVIAPDHEGNTFFDSGGVTQELSVARPLDMIFLFDEFSDFTQEAGNQFEGWIDLDSGFGMTGHSFGAFTSMAVASQDSRVVAALPMALGGPVSDTYDAATLLMLATEDKTIGLAGNDGVRNTFDDAPGPRFIAEIVDAGHYSFSFSCQVGLAGPWDGDGCMDGVRFEDGSAFTFVDDMRIWDVVNGYSAALFGRYIKGIQQYDEVLASNLDPGIMDYIAEP